MHIDNPQMRGLFFCGVTRHVCRGYDRLRLQRSLLRRSRGFRLKVRGERLKAGSFYRLRSKLFYVIARGGVFSSCMCAGVRTCTSREHYIYYSVNGSITKRASESVKKRTYNLPSLTYARKADISNTNTCGSTLVGSTASIFWYNTTSS